MKHETEKDIIFELRKLWTRFFGGNFSMFLARSFECLFLTFKIFLENENCFSISSSAKIFFLSSYCWIKRSFCGKRLASIYGRKATFPETEQTKKLSQSCVDGFFHSSGQSWQISIRFEVVVILLFFRPLRMPSVSLTWLWQIVKVS